MDFKKISENLMSSLRLKTLPIGVSFIEDSEPLKEIDSVKMLDKRLQLCQMLSLGRKWSYTIGATEEDLYSMCKFVLGFLEDPPDKLVEGYGWQWCKDTEDAHKKLDSMQTLPSKFDAVVVSPLSTDRGVKFFEKYEPDITMIYGNPAQMNHMICALQKENYRRFKFFSVGESSCSDTIAQCYNSNEASVTIPCYGERRFAHASDDEMVISLPPEMLTTLVDGIGDLSDVGIEYPVRGFGTNQDPRAGYPKAYIDLLEKAEKESSE